MFDNRILADYPYVLVRLQCDHCGRAGQYRLARLAATYGAQIRLMDLLESLTQDCPWQAGQHREKLKTKRKYVASCGAFFPDKHGGRPPDIPPATRQLKVIAGGKR